MKPVVASMNHVLVVLGFAAGCSSADAVPDGARQVDGPGQHDSPGQLDGQVISDAPPAIVAFQSCAVAGAGTADCGTTHNDNCCATLPVTGGMFDRSYDDVSFRDMSAPATVSDFKLDEYEITVGRFRAFVMSGWHPQPGDGKHAYLPGGGLNAGSEPGWDPAWTASLATTRAGWDTALACAGGATWTSTAGANETLPITCGSWIELYAFCIWDGGFLPTEAEWNYAAAGGTDQRVFPWSSPAMSSAIDCTDATYATCGGAAAAVGSTTAGRGKYGQADLAGNVWERTLDVYASTYVTPSVDAAPVSGTERTLRGGSYVSGATATTMTASFRNHEADTSRDPIVGARCARSPESLSR